MLRLLCAACFLALATSSIVQTSKDNVPSYTAAVVEYYAPEEKAKNLQFYLNTIEYASKKNVDIIVFPEFGLTDMELLSFYDKMSQRTLFHGSELDFIKVMKSLRYRHKLESENFCLPGVDEEKVLCDSQGRRDSEIMGKISCAAKRHNMYVVVNYIEGDCYGRDDLFYNVNVVFDRKGKIIAKYQKQNILNDYVFGQGKNDFVTFTTDFNVTFGLLTSNDVLSQNPIQSLLDNKINNFILSTRWVYEFTGFNLAEFNQGWAYESDVNLLAAGNNIVGDMIGSGIYLGKYGSANTHQFLVNPSNAIIIAKVPLNIEDRQSTQSSMHVFQDFVIQSKLNFLLNNNCNDADQDMYVTLSKESYKKEICFNEDMCCNFEINVNKKYVGNASDITYVMVTEQIGLFYQNVDYRFQKCTLEPCDLNRVFEFTSKLDEPLFESIKISRSIKNSEITRCVPIVGSELGRRSEKSSISFETTLRDDSDVKVANMSVIAPDFDFRRLGIVVMLYDPIHKEIEDVRNDLYIKKFTPWKRVEKTEEKPVNPKDSDEMENAPSSMKLCIKHWLIKNRNLVKCFILISLLALLLSLLLLYIHKKDWFENFTLYEREEDKKSTENKNDTEEAVSYRPRNKNDTQV